MTFDDFAGNLLLKEQLHSFFKSKKIPHSMIFEGPSGSGKKTIANIIAQVIVCSSDNVFSCNTCLNCKKAINKSHPDIIYPEKSGVSQSFNVATVRQIREDSYIIPNEAACKVYFFEDANNMNSSAQNALLKVLEEPPKNVFFIFTCESSSSFLDTIKSRSQIFSVGNVSGDDAFDFICKNYSDFDKSEIKAAVLKSNRNIGRAIEILNFQDTNETLKLAEEIADGLTLKNEYELLKVGAKIPNDRKNLKIFLSYLSENLRNVMVGSIENEIKNQFCIKKILKLINVINKTNNLIDYNVNINLLITYLVSNLYTISFSD